MQDVVLEILDESVAVKRRSVAAAADRIAQAAERIAAGLTAGNKVLIFGNGGSAADAQHVAAEFVNRFRIERPPLAALALTTDTSVLTSISNDYDFDRVFSKQVEALGRRDDIAWGISTSGNSPNVIAGLQKARQMGMFTLGMTGPGGKITDCSDILLPVESKVTARIQETHCLYGHLLCELVDRILFEPMGK